MKALRCFSSFGRGIGCFVACALVLGLPRMVGSGIVGWGSAKAQSKQAVKADVALSPLAIISSGGDGATHRFNVEIASTDKQRLRGLMYRQSLPEDGGMLFDYGTDREIAMWMRNTLIPLDMLFIDRMGKVTHIHENAIPHDETPIPSGGPVRAVLELKGGTVAKLGIRTGDRVQAEMFAAK